MTTGGGDGEIQTEIVKAALLRGRMCESVGDVVRTPRNRDIPAGGSLFLLGLFSDIKMLLGVPVSEILDDTDVTDAVRDAILDHEGPGGTILAAVEGYMEADWDARRAVSVAWAPTRARSSMSTWIRSRGRATVWRSTRTPPSRSNAPSGWLRRPPL